MHKWALVVLLVGLAAGFLVGRGSRIPNSVDAELSTHATEWPSFDRFADYCCETPSLELWDKATDKPKKRSRKFDARRQGATTTTEVEVERTDEGAFQSASAHVRNEADWRAFLEDAAPHFAMEPTLFGDVFAEHAVIRRAWETAAIQSLGWNNGSPHPGECRLKGKQIEVIAKVNGVKNGLVAGASILVKRRSDGAD